MARRSSRIPLYEHMSAGRLRGVPRPPQAERSSPPDVIEPGEEGLRRTIRIPAGYLLVSATAVMLLVVLMYVVGFKRGSESERAEFEQRFLDQSVAIDPGLRARDPLNGTALAGGMRSTGAASDDQMETPGGASASRWGPIDSDPRQAGLHYFVLATTTSQGAARLADFCRSRGLETYVIPGNNPSHRRVIAAPGFRQKTDAGVRRLKEQILDIGRDWKSRFPGESDLSDSYLLEATGN